MNQLLLYLLVILLFLSCNPKQNNDPELHHFVDLLSGSFSSKEQSEKEVGYADSNLINTPIWEDSKNYWLYSEIHNAKNPSLIYIQRILNIQRMDSVTFISTAYTIPDQKKYAHGWKDPNLFNEIALDSLQKREGCDIYYKKKTSSIYVGKTNNVSCLSTLKNIAYTKSNIVLSRDQLSVWDKGYDVDGKQVWGKIQGPYKYKRIQEK
ncbi:chromophore lyase CpcT/CpeT [Aquimarina sp. MMG016]|uniref:chromophore lyase CpcT/CpeT n=1 Tax=Aquimarina sp. MMG016 TaxID=2822690 RepID=UPI001B3A1C81|nr:chromophore lyase CpcT/CpeT [Aquimarina sp. MMG016]MBQ4821420.1 chromophore lyase CpcT/CpeT [Aquimarina sp. MMG016]